MTVARDTPHPTPRRDDTPVVPPFREQVAAELRAHLARHRISGRTLAKLLGENQTWVSRRLSGHVPLDTDDLQRIAEVLGLTPMELLAGVPFDPTVHRRTAPVTDPVIDRITRVCSADAGGQVIPFPTLGSRVRGGRAEGLGAKSGRSHPLTPCVAA
jgi:hypothetical protein